MNRQQGCDRSTPRPSPGLRRRSRCSTGRSSPPPASCRSASPMSAVGDYTGGVLVVGIALVASSFVAVLFRPPISALSSLPVYASRRPRADESAIYATPFYRAFRRALEYCVSHPMYHRRRIGLLGLRIGQFSKVSGNSFRCRTARVVFELRLAEGCLDPGDRSGGEGGRAPDRRGR